MTNPASRGQQRGKPFRDALRVAIADADGDFKALRKVAEALVANAMGGDNVAIKEIADRLDGKVPQAIVGDDDYGPVRLEQIQRVIVDPKHPDSESVPTAAGTEPI